MARPQKQDIKVFLLLIKIIILRIAVLSLKQFLCHTDHKNQKQAKTENCQHPSEFYHPRIGSK